MLWGGPPGSAADLPIGLGGLSVPASDRPGLSMR